MNTLARIRIVLSNTSHPGNIGSAARAMKTMGLSRLYLVTPRHLPEEQAHALASGASDVLDQAVICASLDEALAGTVMSVGMTARRRALSAPIGWLAEVVEDVLPYAQHGEIAIVFGNETAGLSNEEAAMCQRLATIPVNPEFGSLNVAAAVQVACYALRQAAEGVKPAPYITDSGTPATQEEISGLVDHFERAAVGSGYLDPALPKRFAPRMRRLFARAMVEKEEIHLLRGVLAALMKKPE